MVKHHAEGELPQWVFSVCSQSQISGIQPIPQRPLQLIRPITISDSLEKNQVLPPIRGSLPEVIRSCCHRLRHARAEHRYGGSWQEGGARAASPPLPGLAPPARRLRAAGAPWEARARAARVQTAGEDLWWWWWQQLRITSGRLPRGKYLVPLLLTGVRHHPPGRTDKILCRCFGAPATHARRPHRPGLP